MTKHNQTENQPRQARSRKPYVKPSFEREKVFETQAMICGKVQTTQNSCRFNRKNS